MNAKEYQKKLHNVLLNKYEEVIKEWSVWKNATDSAQKLKHWMYAPRLDIAVGPFNIDRNIFDNVNNIKNIAEQDSFINSLGIAGFNNNPRCLLAIEIGFSGSRKHLLGDLVNASLMGYIGLIIAKDNEMKKRYDRINNYIEFAKIVGKTGARGLLENIKILTVRELREKLNNEILEN